MEVQVAPDTVTTGQLAFGVCSKQRCIFQRRAERPEPGEQLIGCVFSMTVAMHFRPRKTACRRAQQLHTAAQPKWPVAGTEAVDIATSVTAGNLQTSLVKGEAAHTRPEGSSGRQRRELEGRVKVQNGMDRAVIKGHFQTCLALVKCGET